MQAGGAMVTITPPVGLLGFWFTEVTLHSKVLPRVAADPREVLA